MRSCCGQGLVCYSKDEWWAECRADCKSEMGWACEALSDRTPTRVTGTWPGEDCTLTRLCNYHDMKCVMKDEFTAYCADDIYKEWNGTVIGQSMRSHVVPTAEHWYEKEAGGSIFCFAAVLPGSKEEKLRALAAELKAGIYSCDATRWFDSSSCKVLTLDGLSFWGNTEVYIKVWQQVFSERVWERHDWTVKADPDCVFWASRLRWRLKKLHALEESPLYVRSSDHQPGLEAPLEVMNQAAVRALQKGFADCARTTSGQAPQENWFLQGCLDAVGSGYMMDTAILAAPAATGVCSDDIAVAFHPLKELSEWSDCNTNGLLP